MKYLAIAALLLLAACGTTPHVPEKEIVIKEVLVPVPVKCSTKAPAKPPVTAPQAQGDVYDKGVALLTDHEELRRYASLLEAALDVCTSDPVR